MKKKAKKTGLIFYKSKGEWRWRVVARNRKILADSGESYKRRKDAVDGALLAGGIISYGTE